MQDSLQQKIGAINSGLLIALIFFVPISTSLSSVLAVLIMLLWLAEGNLASKFRKILQNELALALLAYISLFIIGLLWTDDLAWGLKQTKKQWKLLLYLPLLTTARREHYRHYFISFISAMLLSAILSFLLWLEIIHFKDVLPRYPIPFNSHISYNPLLALALYLVYHRMIFTPQHQPRQLATLLVAGIAMTGSMFITTGRTGQIAFFVLTALLALQYFSKRIVAGIMAVIVLVPLLLTTAYYLGPGFRARITEAVSDIREYRSKPEKSTAQRLTFAENSLKMAADSIWIGVGTGDFPAEYRKTNEKNSPAFAPVDDPHNHYLLVLTQFGLVGLATFLSIFVVQLRQAFTINDGYRHFRVALPIFYLTIMTGGTYLLGQELSLCFAIGSALLYKSTGPPGASAQPPAANHPV